MKTLIKTFLLVTAITLANVTPSFSQSSEQLFQKGVIKEEGEGSLLEAIDIYNQIVEDKKAELSLQAKALLRVGLCYEKLGRDEATKAYQRLVKNYPGQKSEVAIARERLSLLIQIAEEVLNALVKPTFRKIRTPFNIPFWSGSSLSPDGKTLAFGSENTIWTVPIPGKVDPDLAGEPKKLPGAADVPVGAGLSWSADGRWIAFSRAWSRGEGTRINFNPERAYIDVIPSSGGEAKRIPIPQWAEPHVLSQLRLSLSPEGKIVAFDAGGQIYVASVETGDIRQITKDGGIFPCFSPDGKKIAYFTPPIRKENPDRRISDVWVISSDGNDPVKVISGDLLPNITGTGPVWSPDGKMLAFGRLEIQKALGITRSEVCIVPLSNEGKPVASPVQIELPQWTTEFMTGWTPDNKIGLILETGYHEYVYTIPVNGGKATQVSPLDGLASHPRWSPDGERIFFRWKGDGLGSAPGDGGKVHVHPISDQIRSIYPGPGNSISPDGKSIVFASGGSETSGRGIYTSSVQGGGEPRQITNGGYYPCWSPDGKWIAYMAEEIISEEKSITTIFKIPVEGGEAQKITTSSDNVTEAGINWSPDGKMIAYFSKKENTSAGTLNLVPINGGKSREVCRTGNVNAWCDLSWSPNGQKIAFTSRGKIWIVSADGDELMELKTGVGARAGTLDWSPDGKKIAFSGETGMDKEFWLMEDFLPLEKLAQNKDTEVASEAEGISIKQLWKKPYQDALGTVTSDGQFRSGADWGNGDLALHNLETGEIQLLTNNAGENGMALQSAISKNNKQIAYSWWVPGKNTDLLLVDINNPKPRLLHSAKEDVMYPATWLSDKELIITRMNTETRIADICSFNILNTTINPLKTFEMMKWPQLASSPDEKYIAYDFGNETHDGAFDINILSLDGTGEIELVKHPANDRVLGWVPGRKEFLFISDRSGSWDLWALPVNDGKQSGLAKLIYSDIGEVTPLGFSQKGDCFIGFSRMSFNNYLAPIDVETGEVGLESGISLPGSGYWLDWSPDGKFLIKGVHIVDVKTGDKRKLSANMNRIISPCWSPDGTKILFVGLDKAKNNHIDYRGDIYVVDAQSGQTIENIPLSNYKYKLPLDDAFPLSNLEWSSDGKSFYYLFFKDRLAKHNLETGEDEILYEHPHFDRGVFSRSPDGKKLLFTIRTPEQNISQLCIMSEEDGELIELCSPQEGDGFGMAIWSPDGNNIFYSNASADGTSLWRIPAKGGKPKKVWHSEAKLEVFKIHPDGKQIAITIRERASVVRVIEGLVKELEKIYSINN